MDEKTALIMTVSALQETFRALASEAITPSYAVVDQINSVFKAINKIVPGANFSTSFDFMVAARPVEVLPQLKLPLNLLGHGSTSTTEGAQDKPVPLGAKTQPAQKAKPRIFIGCSMKGLTEAKLIQMQLESADTTVERHAGDIGRSGARICLCHPSPYAGRHARKAG